MSVTLRASTPTMERIFSVPSEVQSWLDVEAALAEAEAEAGLIPGEAAATIRSKANVELVDLDRLVDDMSQVVHPIVPFVRQFAEICGDPAGRYVHWGATTTDILDSGLMLRAKRANETLYRDLSRLAELFKRKAIEHRMTVMAGRTHGQQALPITLGFKLAIWADELDRHLEAARSHDELLAGQLGGAVGTLASLGEAGPGVRARTMEILGLANSRIPWGVSRDRLLRVAMNLSLVAVSLERFALECMQLQRTEIAEVTEPFHHGKVGSSTMPHKRNPALCETLVSISQLARAALDTGMRSATPVHEREKVSYTLDMVYVPNMFGHVHRCIELALDIVEGMHVDEARMARNLDMTGGLIASEALMMALANSGGRQTAHDRLYELAFDTSSPGTFAERVSADPVIQSALTPEQLQRALSHDAAINSAARWVDAVCCTDEPRPTPI